MGHKVLHPTMGQTVNNEKANKENQMVDSVSPEEPEKKSGMELADEEPKARKKREPAIVRIYHSIKGQPTFQPVKGTSGAEPMTFLSTQEAVAWARKNLTQNGETYQIVTVQREFTVKAEQVPKVSWE